MKFDMLVLVVALEEFFEFLVFQDNKEVIANFIIVWGSNAGNLGCMRCYSIVLKVLTVG